MTEILDPTILTAPAAENAPQNTPRKRGRPPGSKSTRTAKVSNIDPKAQEQLHEMLLLGFGALTLFMAVELRPTQYELDAILLPAERIMLRRVSGLEAFSPDVYDGIQLMIGLVSYGARVVTNRQPSTAKPATNGDTGNIRPMAKVSVNPKTDESSGGNGFSSIDGQLAALYSTVSGHSARNVESDANLGH